MNKYFSAVIVAFILIISFTQISQATGLYSKPEFRGRVIDAETKQPIEGAVVVVMYYKMHLIGAPGGPSVVIMDAKETLTDKNGEFFFPAYSAVLLFSKGTPTRFIFYKPGYISNSYPADVEGELIEKYFSGDVVGKEATIHNDLGRVVSYKGPLGIMELKKVSPAKAMSPGYISDDYGPNQLPLYYKAIEEDLVNRGIIQGGKKK